MSKVYLGDSVYAAIDEAEPFSVLLTTENGLGPSNQIFLDSTVVAALISFLQEQGWAL